MPKNDVKEIAQKARQFLIELMKSQEQDINRLSLEEIEYDENEGIWLITLSYAEDLLSPARKYKVIRIKDNTSEIISVKIRDF